jgi:hypothetical protein
MWRLNLNLRPCCRVPGTIQVAERDHYPSRHAPWFAFAKGVNNDLTPFSCIPCLFTRLDSWSNETDDWIHVRMKTNARQAVLKLQLPLPECRFTELRVSSTFGSKPKGRLTAICTGYPAATCQFMATRQENHRTNESCFARTGKYRSFHLSPPKLMILIYRSNPAFTVIAVFYMNDF